ncbi:M3 family oligoendopeptidase [Bacillus sp. SCS-153A]|uniref:M3 family oligoendopeptidase n=1 Tax=Rossellomorea sedimentorum TaxID=3115294 RepID=UPI0039067B93
MIKQKKNTESQFCFSDFSQKFEGLLREFSQTEELEDLNRLLRKLNNLRFDFETAKNSYTLQHVQNHYDEKAEKEYNDLVSMDPEYQKLVQNYYKSLLCSPKKEELQKHWGKQLFRLAQAKVHSYDESIKEDIQLENRLMGEYGKLLGTAEAEYKGSKIGLSSLAKYMASSDRVTRQSAYEARAMFFAENEEKFDDILHQLIIVRTRISRKLGRENFVSLGYERMNRTDLSPFDLKRYRQQVKKHGVDFVSSLREMQKNRLGVGELKFYDDKIMDAEGPPSLKVDTKQILDEMKVVFEKLSTETDKFFKSLMEKGNYDVLPRTGKSGGGYATYLGNDKDPFIFANLSGVANDVSLFTHEMGHAFQFYMSRNWNCPEYIIPVDAAEIFSFAMERLTLPWMDAFFGEDTMKYKFSHLIEAFMYMPLASAVDEFEHFLYEHPEATKRERKEKWRELEESYQPEIDYDGNEYLEAGCGFHGIAHIYFNPFYFIDYDIAHILAVQLWDLARRNPKQAWKSYLEMCKAGGSRSLKEHINAAGLKSPFEEDSLSEVFSSIEKWLYQHGFHNK